MAKNYNNNNNIILLIDDKKGVLSPINVLLNNLHFNTKVVCTFDEGLACLKTMKVSLILFYCCDTISTTFCYKIRNTAGGGNSHIVALIDKSNDDDDCKIKNMIYSQGVQECLYLNQSEKLIESVYYHMDMLDVYTNQKNDAVLDKSQKEFVSVVSHEMRTPMTSIQSAISLINDGLIGEFTPDQNEVFDVIGRNIVRLSRLIATVSDLYSVDSGNVNLELSVCNVKVLIDEVVEFMQPLIKEKNASIKIDYDNDQLKTNCDRRKIIQVMMSLVENSLVHNSGEIAINILVKSANKKILIHIADNGEGIPVELHDKIFERFYQIKRKVGEGTQGLGVSLSMCRGYIKAHRGSLKLNSEESKGSEFSFDLEVYDDAS